jgi:DEAD/DEAH box helicase domain-containing protein
MTGYPGTMMSVWQQAGRAGRRTSDALGILIAMQNPLDQFFMRHPEAFFTRPHEHAIIDTKNPYIISGQILCAASELPIRQNFDSRCLAREFATTLRHWKNAVLLPKHHEVTFIRGENEHVTGLLVPDQ